MKATSKKSREDKKIIHFPGTQGNYHRIETHLYDNIQKQIPSTTGKRVFHTWWSQSIGENLEKNKHELANDSVSIAV
jgi:hypothetical protein